MAFRYLGVSDIELIESWTPREFNLLLEGAQHKQIDERELLAWSAVANEVSRRAKRPKEKKIFDASKARRMLDNGEAWGNARQRMDLGTVRKFKDSLKGFTPEFRKKGGN